MTLDEAIKHCEEVAEEAKKTPCIKGGLVEKCGKEHEELAAWLKAYKENSQGDLISRSEAEKLGATCLARRNENGQLEAIISLDNAPTVEVTKPQSYTMGFCDGLKAQTYEKPPMFERPQGDLISREALRKAFHERIWHFDKSSWDEANVLIDNAPTVCGNNPKWCESCVSKGKCASTRTQGEWIFLKANEEQTDGYECSVCKATFHTRVPYFSEFNFCPNCGADMRGEQE